MLNLHQNVIFETEDHGLKVGYSQYYIRIYARTTKKCAIIKPKAKYLDGIIGEDCYE